MRGPKIDDWAQDKRQWVEQQDRNGRDPEGETYWLEFQDAFNEAYADGNRESDAVHELLKLRMQGTDLDTYNAKFSQLLLRSQWGHPDAGATKRLYQEGLPKQLWNTIIYLVHPKPDTLEEWKEAARRMHKAWMETQQTVQRRGILDGIMQTPRRTNWQQGQGQQRRRDPNAMDVDAAQTTPVRTKLTPELREKLRKAGCCFYCRQPGHMSFDCPNRPGRSGNNQRPPAKARNAEMEPTTPATANKDTTAPMPSTKFTPADFAKGFLNMSEEDRIKMHQIITGVQYESPIASDF